MTTLKELSEGMERRWIMIGCVMMALAVISGAFGAHALQGLLDEKYSHTYQTAVTYHVYHAMALIITGILQPLSNTSQIKIAYRFFLIGLLLFSGSLYILTLMIAFAQLHYGWLGAITPFGGMSFIIGWLMLAVAVKNGK
jgi:uncharacterized membrane protein YgdD (TMEM256/DUF423 family)